MPTPLIRKLEAFGPLPDRDKRALEQAVERTRRVGAGHVLVREGDRPTECRLILQGFAYRHRTLEDGRRQIMSFEIPGDLCDLHGFPHLSRYRSGVIPYLVCRYRSSIFSFAPSSREAMWSGNTDVRIGTAGAGGAGAGSAVPAVANERWTDWISSGSASAATRNIALASRKGCAQVADPTRDGAVE